MKTWKWMAACVAVLTLSVGLISCGDDKDDAGGNNGNGQTDVFVGTWKYTFSSGYIMLVVESDGSYYTQEYDTNDGGSHSKKYGSWHYDASTKCYTLVAEKDGAISTVKNVDDSTLMFIDPDGKTRTFSREKTGSSSAVGDVFVGTWKYTFGSGYIMLVVESDGRYYTQEYDTNDGGLHSKKYGSWRYDASRKSYILVDDKKGYESVVTIIDNNNLVLLDSDEKMRAYARQ